MTYDPETWVDYTTPCIDAAHLNAIEHGVDIAQGDIMVLRGLTANIPATDAELVGRLYIETDLLERIWRDNGAGWDLVITPGGGAWTLIAETIVGAPGAAAVTFLAIPQTYRTLWLFAAVRTDRAAEFDYVLWQANADGAANYDRVQFYTTIAAHFNGGARAQTAGYAGFCEAANSRAANFGPTTAIWQDYASATIEKTSLVPLSAAAGDRSADADVMEHLYSSWWRNTAAITRLDFIPQTGPNFVAGSRFTLYGIT